LLHVKDVANAIVFCLENNIHGLFNLSSDNYKIIDIAYAIKKVIPHAEIQGSDISFEDLRNYRVNNEKFKQTGWIAHHTLEDGIKEMLEVFKENRVKNVDDPVYLNVTYMKKLYNLDLGVLNYVNKK
jgi:nucleoside-diphosphate-sugar epimerase